MKVKQGKLLEYLALTDNFYNLDNPDRYILMFDVVTNYTKEIEDNTDMPLMEQKSLWRDIMNSEGCNREMEELMIQEMLEPYWEGYRLSWFNNNDLRRSNK